jgi:cell division protein FtsQ
MHLQKNKKILIYIFLFLIIGTLNNKNLNKVSFIKINDLLIKGLDEDNNFQLIKKLNYLKTNDLFFLDKSKIEKIINANNLVEKFSVFKIYPSTLDITIYKTNFLAQTKINGNNFILGSNGKLIKTNKLEKKLPTIYGDFKVKNFFELRNIINKTNFDYNDIKNLFFFKSGRWDIETKNGLLVKLPKNDLKKSLELFLNFLAKEDFKKIKKIDLRQHNQIITNG